MTNALLLQPTDDVAVLKRSVRAGERVEFFDSTPTRNAKPETRNVIATRDIAPGHKVALHDIASGAPVKKYGQIIGFARGAIKAGDWLHTHNIELRDFGRDYAFCEDARAVDYYPAEAMRYFQGFARADGRAGTQGQAGPWVPG